MCRANAAQYGTTCRNSSQVAKGGFPVMAEISRCHTFTKEINHRRARSQYFNENSSEFSDDRKTGLSQTKSAYISALCVSH